MAMLTIQILCAAFVLSSATESVLEEYEVQEQLPVLGEMAGEGMVLSLLADGEGEVVEEGEEVEELTGEETFGTEAVNWAENRIGCPSGWTKYGARCFRFINSARSWSRAEGYCVHYGANLASVHSSAEYHFVQGVIMRQTGDFTPTWLGGTDAVQNRVWFWSDGSRFDYQNWRRGEPNNYKGREPCIMINYKGEYGFNDIPCGNSYAFICSLKLPDC